MTSAGAIALAEFLPESTSLLHLDLTVNNLDIAGVMALSSGLKANHVMRCLDVNIPPGDEAFARSVVLPSFLYRGGWLTPVWRLECVGTS
jgi:protein phosphatase 1 regulatory subunit 37